MEGPMEYFKEAGDFKIRGVFKGVLIFYLP